MTAETAARRPSRSRWRPAPARVATVVLVVLIAFLALRIIVRHKLSEAFFEEAAIPSAFAVNPHDGMTAGYLAWTLQRSGQTKAVVPIARHAFAETTLSAPALGALALADPQRGGRLFGFAAAAGWRDPLVQTWLARAALDQGDATQAATHIDAAARVQGANGEIRALIDRMAAAPALRSAIAARLALGPRWRFEYFISPADPMGSIAARAAILGALAGTASPPTKLEVLAVTVLGVRTAGFPFGYDVWRGVTRAHVADFVYDPDFRAATDDPDDFNPFVWHLAASPGATSEVTQDNGRSALHVTGDGLSAASVAVQMLRISPGRHRLLASGRFSIPAAASGFRWTLTCWNAHKPVAFVEPLAGDATGNAGFSFDVPADGTCPMARIELSTQQGGNSGQTEAWFNSVRIE